MARTTPAAGAGAGPYTGLLPLLSSKPSLRRASHASSSYAADDESSSDSDSSSSNSSSSSNEQSDDDDAALEVSEGDWRAFRAADGGGFGLGGDDGGDGSDAKTKAEDRRKAVAPGTRRPAQQNPKLAADYMEGGGHTQRACPKRGLDSA